MASTYLSRTFTSGNRKTFTISVWFKLGNSSIGSSSYEAIIAASGGDHGIWIRGDKNELDLYFTQNLVGTTSIRDVNAWYHLVVGVDTTQSTASNRVKVYLNGEQFTSLDDGAGGSVTYPSLNADTQFNNNGGTCTIGSRASTNEHYWNGSMSHFHFCDGTQYAASDFGSTDSTTGEWKINPAPSVSYGTNGFFILKDGTNLSGSTVQDQSGQGNNFTVGGGTLTKTEDNPSNVFATMNSLSTNNSSYTFANGNTTVNSSTQWLGSNSTLGMAEGKWYWEVKHANGNTGIGIGQVGNGATDTTNLSTANSGYSGKYSRGYELFKNGSTINRINNNSTTGYGTVQSAGDIIMVAFDADNGTIWTGKNGTWHNSATQTEIENGTTTNAMYSGIDMSEPYLATGSIENGELQFNFGNGYFGTTAISSEGTNASGIGKFEYDVPTGFTALSTKGLNE